MTGFRAMLDAIDKKGEERSAQELNNPPDIEEQHREQYPDICTPECEHVTCPYRTEENRGRPCFMKWKQYETLPQSMPSAVAKPTPYAQDRSLTKQIEDAIAKAFKPITDRIKALENEPEHRVRQPHLRGLNGKRQRLDVGTNQERIQD